MSYYLGMLLLVFALVGLADYFWPGFYTLSSTAIIPFTSIV